MRNRGWVRRRPVPGSVAQELPVPRQVVQAAQPEDVQELLGGAVEQGVPGVGSGPDRCTRMRPDSSRLATRSASTSSSQMSAAHDVETLDRAIDAFAEVGRELGLIA